MRAAMLVAVVAISVIAGAGSIGCSRSGSTGPTEADLLPEATLTFPRATESQRSFQEESNARGIDGNDLSGPVGCRGR